MDLGFAKIIDPRTGPDTECWGGTGLCSGAVFAIEWAEKVGGILKQYSDEAKIIWVKIRHGKKENERVIEWSDVLRMK